MPIRGGVSVFFEERGFTMVEVAIAMGIAMVGILASTAAVTYSTRTVQKNKAASDFSSQTSAINALLNDSTACNQTLTGVSLAEDQVALDGISIGGESPSYVAAPSGTHLSNGFTVTKLQLEVISRPSADRAVARLVYGVNRTIASEGGGSERVEQVPEYDRVLNLKLDPATQAIVGCAGPEDALDEVVKDWKEDTCELQGGMYIEATQGCGPIPGVADYVVPGTYTFVVPPFANKLNISVWGGSGGSGGAFVHWRCSIYQAFLTFKRECTWVGTFGGTGGGGGAYHFGEVETTPGTTFVITVANAGAGGQGTKQTQVRDCLHSNLTNCGNYSGGCDGGSNGTAGGTSYVRRQGDSEDVLVAGGGAGGTKICVGSGAGGIGGPRIESYLGAAGASGGGPSSTCNGSPGGASGGIEFGNDIAGQGGNGATDCVTRTQNPYGGGNDSRGSSGESGRAGRVMISWGQSGVQVTPDAGIVVEGLGGVEDDE